MTQFLINWFLYTMIDVAIMVALTAACIVALQFGKRWQ
jgi:hypothetical protein